MTSHADGRDTHEGKRGYRPGSLEVLAVLLLLLIIGQRWLVDLFDNPALQTGATIFISIVVQALPFPVLGVVLVDKERIVRLSRGEPWELELLESVDGRIGRRSGVSESTIHRILATDLDGDGGDDLLLCDDRRHQLTALMRQPAGAGAAAKLERSVSWKVFDDRKYPYDGGESQEMVSEPRWVAGLDADADGVHDLALVSQDRLLIYVGRDPGEESP